MTKAHTIHTTRLILRTPQIRDAAAYQYLNTNKANNRYNPSPLESGGNTASVEKYRDELIPKWRAATEKGEAAFMLITLPGDGSPEAHDYGADRQKLVGEDGEIVQDRVIGITGFNELVWRTAPRGEPTEPGDGLLVGDIGMLIDAPEHVGKGYAKEAAVALVEYGFGPVGCDALTASTMEINELFRGLMGSIGFGEGVIEAGRMRNGKEVSEAIYVMKKEEWKSLRSG